MNHLASDTFIDSVLNALSIAVGHMIALFAVVAIALVLWVRAIAPTIGVDTHTVRIEAWLIPVALVLYACLAWIWHSYKNAASSVDGKSL